MITVLYEIGADVCLFALDFIDFHFNWIRFIFGSCFFLHHLYLYIEAIVVRATSVFRHQQRQQHPFQHQGTSRQVLVLVYTILFCFPFSRVSLLQGEMKVTRVCIDTSNSPGKTATTNKITINFHSFYFFFFLFSLDSIPPYHVRRTEQSMFHLHVLIH